MANQQSDKRRLSVSFTCPTNIAVGDVVRLNGDGTVKKVDATAAVDIVGTVVAHAESATTCAVETRFRERRDDRVAYSELALGPFVWTAASELVGYTEQAYATVTGAQTGPFVIVAAAPGTATGTTTGNQTIVAAAAGTVTGTTTGVHTIVLGTSDALKLKVGAGASQTVTLTAGVDVTMETVAGEINAQTTDLTASVDGTGHLVLTADSVADALEVEAVANDAYTLLGLTAAVYAATAPVDKVKVAVGGGASQTVTLTAGTRTITQIAADINSGTTDLTASVDGTGHLVLTADNVAHDLVVEAVTGDAYDEIGIPAATYAATAPLDKVKITMGSGSPQTFTLTPGSRTITQIVADFAAGTGFTASSSGGALKITSTDLQDSVIVGAVTGDAYTALGLTAATTAPTARSHDPSAIGGLMIKGPELCQVIGGLAGPFAIVNGASDAMSVSIAGGASQVFDLTAGAALTAEEIATNINATATDFTAGATEFGQLTLTADNQWDSIEIETVSNNAYTALGLTVATTAAPMTVETLEY